MKVKKWIEVETEVEVEICADDITVILEEGGPSDYKSVLRNINRIGTFLRSIPGELIANKLSDHDRKIIGEFLVGAGNDFLSPRLRQAESDAQK